MEEQRMKKYVISGIEIKISDEVQEYIEACNIWFDKAYQVNNSPA